MCTFLPEQRAKSILRPCNPFVVNQSAALNICFVACALGQQETTVVLCEDARGTPGAGMSVHLCLGFFK